MIRHTNTQTITFDRARKSRVFAITGEVAVEVWNGVAFVVDDKSPMLTCNHIVTTRGLRIRLTPTVGSDFSYEEGIRQ